MPNAPSALTAQTASTSTVNLAWQDNSSNEVSFRVEQLVSGAFQQVQVLAAGATQVQIAGLAPATAYTFRVRAANDAGISTYSNAPSATTQALRRRPLRQVRQRRRPPSALTAQGPSSSAIHLSWQDNSNNETSLRVEQLVDGAFQQVQVLAAGATQVQIIGLAPTTAYTFRVRAANAAGFSAYSNTASATTPVAAPTPPPTSPVPALRGT